LSPLVPLPPCFVVTFLSSVVFVSIGNTPSIFFYQPSEFSLTFLLISLPSPFVPFITFLAAAPRPLPASPSKHSLFRLFPQSSSYLSAFFRFDPVSFFDPSVSLSQGRSRFPSLGIGGAVRPNISSIPPGPALPAEFLCPVTERFQRFPFDLPLHGLSCLFSARTSPPPNPRFVTFMWPCALARLLSFQYVFCDSLPHKLLCFLPFNCRIFCPWISTGSVSHQPNPSGPFFPFGIRVAPSASRWLGLLHMVSSLSARLSFRNIAGFNPSVPRGFHL